jgi:hypothetical protein
MGVEINIEHPEGKQSGAYCATDRGPAAHGLVSYNSYNAIDNEWQAKVTFTVNP